MILFPYIFGRIGGGSINELEGLKCSATLTESIAELLELNKELEQVKFEIITLLYHMIQTEKDARIQNNLLNLKRAVFNNKTVASLAFFYDNYLREIKEDTLNNLLITYSQCYEKRSYALEKNTTRFKDEIDISIKNLDTLCHANYLSNGFLFASEKLSRSVGQPTFYKKQKEKTVFSLLKYLTRSVTKTTPFSTFNTVFCIDNQNNGVSEIVPTKESCISPSNLVFLLIKKWLLFLPESRTAFRVSINTSLMESAEHYQFFINKDNNEFLKRIKKTPICDLIKSALDKNPSLNYGDLVFLVREQTNGSTEDVSTHIDKIITEGFILLEFPVSMYDSAWPERLAHFIKTEIASENDFVLTTISDLLLKLSLTKVSLELVKNHVERKKLLTSLQRQLDELKKLLHQKHPDFPSQNLMMNASFPDLYYEDSLGISNVKSQAPNFEFFSEKICGLRRSLGRFDERKIIRQMIKNILVNEFQGQPVALLTLLELYYNQKNKFELEVNGKLLELVQSPHHLYFKVIEAIENCKTDVLDLVNVLPAPYEKRTDPPYGLYTQVTCENNSPILIINGESVGYGKNCSRFLNYFDPKVSKEVISRLKANHPDAIIADVHDASIHNTNTYPVFTDFQIEIPGSEPDPRATQKIPLSDLFVTVENEDVILTLKNGQKIIPFNFSMENINRKSSIIKFFDLFSGPSDHPLLVMEIASNYLRMKLLQSERMMSALPRILYNGSIVVGRRKWLVKKIVFADILASAHDKFSFDRYLKISQWRITHRIPDEVFVKIKKRQGDSYSSYKPQYVNFEIPLLVACFISLLEDASEIIEITEMLPVSRDLNENIAGDKYVQEFVLNYN